MGLVNCVLHDGFIGLVNATFNARTLRGKWLLKASCKLLERQSTVLTDSGCAAPVPSPTCSCLRRWTCGACCPASAWARTPQTRLPSCRTAPGVRQLASLTAHTPPPPLSTGVSTCCGSTGPVPTWRSGGSGCWRRYTAHWRRRHSDRRGWPCRCRACWWAAVAAVDAATGGGLSCWRALCCRAWWTSSRTSWPWRCRPRAGRVPPLCRRGCCPCAASPVPLPWRWSACARGRGGGGGDGGVGQRVQYADQQRPNTAFSRNLAMSMQRYVFLI